MAATHIQHIVSASWLADGSVAYLRADRSWSPRFEDAARFDDVAARDEAHAFAKGDESRVCNAHVFEVGALPDGTLALTARERLRRDGGEAVRRRLGYAG